MWGFFAVVGVLTCLVVVFGIGFVAGVAVASALEQKKEEY